MPEFVYVVNETDIAPGLSLQLDDVGIVQTRGARQSKVFFIRIWAALEVSNRIVATFDHETTGDAHEKKICNVCHKLLDTNLFDKNQNAKNNRSVRRPSCRTCRRTLDGVAMSPRARAAFAQRKPDLTPFECPVCLKRTIAGLTSKVVLDHNHLTGDPRDWICDSCNTGIGRFKDDIDLLERAIRFLRSEPE